MDYLAYFFVATDDAAATAVKGAPAHRSAPAVFVDAYDAEEAVVEWEGLFTGTDPDSIVRSGEPRHVAEILNDGCYVFVLSQRLQDWLGSADAAAIDQLAREWTKVRRASGDPLVEADVVPQLNAVADLARAARAQGCRVYCSGW